MASLLPTLITRLVSRAVALYYRVERRGPPLPEGPVLVIANHLNALVDPLVVFRVAERPVRPLAKAPLFEHPLIGPALRGLGGLPVYRRSDDPELLHLNDRTFDAAIDALRAGQAVQIYPEGQSHSGPRLTPLKTGAARIALQAEADAGWSLGLRVVPVGLLYQRREFFRGRALAVVGEPLRVDGLREAWADDEREAVRALTGSLTEALAAVTLNLESHADRDLVETAELVWTRHVLDVPPRQREGPAERMPRWQALARGLTWLRTHDPQRWAALRRAVARYRRLEARFGAGEAVVPARYAPLGVAVYGVRESAVLLLLAGPALAAAIAWWPPYRAAGWAAAAARPAPDAVSTYKLGAALLAFPLAWIAWIGLAAWAGGPDVAAAVGLLLPLCGVAWIAFAERARRVREDVRAFARAAPRRHARERMDALRHQIVDELEAVREEMARQDPEPAGATDLG